MSKPKGPTFGESISMIGGIGFLVGFAVFLSGAVEDVFDQSVQSLPYYLKSFCMLTMPFVIMIVTGTVLINRAGRTKHPK